jgi:hypothetical protein
MKPSFAAFSLTCLLMTPLAYAQDGPRVAPGAMAPPVFRGAPGGPTSGPVADPANSAPAAPDGTADRKVFPAQSALPEPTPPDQIKPATIALPNDPIEPYLLTRDNGPFMVLARTFRGPDADRCALALVLELRREYGLPAYILRIKDFPNRSNIRNVPPMAPEFIRKSQLTEPEKVRSYDEAAVLVGNEKTLAGSEALWKKVKHIKPKCLNEIPTIFGWRMGLSTAIRTTNPYVPTQDIFPGRKKDALIHQMNDGPRSIFHCPGRYALQVVEFSGRSIVNPDVKDFRVFDNDWLRKSPLATAAEDAERVADALSRDPEVRRTGYQPYVYHGRTSSKVLIGAFNDPKDPNAAKLRDTLVRRAIDLSDSKTGAAGVVIAPANYLTDLEDPNQPLKPR